MRAMSQDIFRLVRRRPSSLLIVGFAVFSLLLWGLVLPPSLSAQAKDGDDAAPMSFHQLHVDDQEVVCTDCHEAPDDPKPGQELSLSVRPGHDACESCHDDEFEEEKLTPANASTEMCMTCHTGKGAAVGSFPSGKLTLSQFSHATHVDPRQLVSKSRSIRQDCGFCHKVSAAAAEAGQASHPECAACHAGARAAKPVLAKDDDVKRCQACHSIERISRNMMKTAAAAPAKVRRRDGAHGAAKPQRAYRDIRPINHGSHLKRRDGAAVDCVVCHQPVVGKHRIDETSRRPSMRQCSTCHDNAAFVRAERLTKKCQGCHTTIRADMRPRPTDPVSAAIVHSPAFRTNHELQARDVDNQCSACHRGAVNVSQNSCAGCHNSMQPLSHLPPRFKEMRHGRLAGFDRQSCASCHSGDFCIRCHNSLPRSHVPLASFVGQLGGAHREMAIFNLRSCFVCHTFENDCLRCHRQELRR